MAEIPSQILAKMEHYCAYQERCESEVRAKLNKFPVTDIQKDDIVQWLIDNKFIDEERFTEIYIRSKMAAHQWGKMKLRQGLFQKQINREIVERKIQAIDNEEYIEMMRSTLSKWIKTHPQHEGNKQKIFAFLLSKGYTTDDIYQILN